MTDTPKRTSKKTQPSKMVSNQQLMDWYKEMRLWRKFEEKAGQMYGMQKIRGFCHLYIGQEAVLMGVKAAIQEGDNLITAYRDHAHAIAVGISPKEVMAELYGKETGSTKGKGGSMHFFSKENRLFGGHGIVGGQIPLGAGIAFAEKYKGTNNVCVTFMGDGAVRQGALHETFTMSMLWNIPVLYICENNRYGMGTSVERTTNKPDLYTIGEAYDMPSKAVDGMNVLEVYDAVVWALEHVRKGTPCFLEIKTYRYKGHSMSDPAKYRTREEVEEFKNQDPIMHIESLLLSKKIVDEAWFKEVDNIIKKEIDEAVEFAENSNFPNVSEMFNDVYVQNDYPFMKDEY
jgi:pyruvate dehydrogenase E1 component alpha subunit